jgi:hypothetical protein
MEGIENVGREIHPRTLRFGSRLSLASTPIATTGDTDIATGSDPQRASKPPPATTGP